MLNRNQKIVLIISAATTAAVVGFLILGGLGGSRKIDFSRFSKSIKIEFDESFPGVSASFLGKSISFGLVDFRNGAKAERVGKKLIWRDVYQDTDIVYEVVEAKKREYQAKEREGSVEGVKETIVLKSKKAPKSFGFRFNISEGIVFEKDDNNNIFFTNDGQYLYHIPQPVMWDANGKATTNIRVKILRNKENDSDFVFTFKPNINWLLAEERVFPIYLDPSIVHDTEAEFDAGSALNRVESIAGPKVQLPYHELPADEHTVGLWHMNEGSGKTIADSSGNGNDGSLEGYTCGPGHTDNGDGTCTATFYPDANPETSSFDGYIPNYNDPGLSWDTIHDAESAQGYDAGVEIDPAYIRSGSDTNTWMEISRGIFLFDTSGLPDNAEISAATLSIHGSNKGGNAAWGIDLNVYSVETASNIAITASDYSKFGTIPFSTTITEAGFSTTGYNDFPLNSSGLAAISKTGVSKFGMRDASRDVADNPPTWQSLAYRFLRCYSAEKGPGYKPKLVVTYTPPADPTWAWKSGSDCKFGSCLSFDGSDDYVNTSLTMANGDKTLSLWVKPSSDMSSGRQMFGGNTADTTHRFYIGCNSGNFYLGGGTTSDSTSISLLDTSVKWHHFVLVHSGSNMLAYQNGVYAGTVSWSGTNEGTINIGRAGGAGNVYSNGIIDEVRIFNRVLTPEEIKADAQRRPYGIYTSSVLDLSAEGAVKTIDSISWQENIEPPTAPSGWTEYKPVIIDNTQNSEGGCIWTETDFTDGFTPDDFTNTAEDSGSVRLDPPPAELDYMEYSTDATARGAYVSSGWWDADWSYRKKLTFSNSSYEEFSDFPVLIHLKDGGGNGTIDMDFAEIKAGGVDIRFIDADDTTELKYEIEKWDDSAEEAWIWVKVPFIDKSSSDFIYMYWGNSGASDNQDPANVWESNFKMVQHMKDITSSSITDSTTNDNDGTKKGADEPIEATGKLYKGQDFDKADDYINTGSGTSIDNIFDGGGTIEAWIKPSSVGENYFGRITDKVSNILYLGLSNGGSSSLMFYYVFDTHVGSWYTTNKDITFNTWQYVAVTYCADCKEADPYIYIDGSNKNITEYYTPSGTRVSDAGDDLYIGNNLDSDRTFDGVIDEVRISTDTKSANWIAAQYKSMTDSYITAGSKEDFKLRAYSESPIKTQGSYSLKAIAKQTTSLNQTLTRTVSPTIDLSNHDKIKFDIRASRTGSNIKIGIHDLGGTTTEITPNILSADTWQTETWDISGVEDAIDKIIITMVNNADAQNTFYIDNMYAGYPEDPEEGSVESYTKNIGGTNYEWGVMDWNWNGVQTLTAKVQTKTSDSGWNLDSASEVTKGQDISELTSVTDGHQYIRWKFYFSTSDDIQTPVLDGVTINYTSLSNYQVKVHVDYSSDMQSNFDDLRFTNSLGDNLSYWIEEKSDGVEAEVWVEVDSIAASDVTTIFMWYGNSEVSAGSSFDDTFTKEYRESGLAGRWHMDEGSGTTIADSSGNGNTGTLGGDGEGTDLPSWVGSDGGQWDGRSDVTFSSGDSLSFDGDDYVDCGNDSSLDFGDNANFSVGYWVKTTQSPVSFVGIMTKQKDSANYQHYGFRLDSTGKIYFIIRDTGGAETQVWSNTALNDGGWHHIVGVASGNDFKIFVDGTLDEGKTEDRGDISNTGDFLVGMNRPGDPKYFNGTIDEVRIFNRALSAQEIRTHYERRKYTSPEPVTGVGGDIELQTRTGPDNAPDDGDWEEWKPIGSGTQIESLDDDAKNWELQTSSVSGIPMQTVDVNPTAPSGPTGCSSNKPVLINNLGNSEDLTNHQVKLEVEYLTGMLSDFSDLRFTNDAGGNLDYWIGGGKDKIETLRPNADYSTGALLRYPASGDFYDKVDEETSDGDSTYVYAPFNVNSGAFFELPNPDRTGKGVINKVVAKINSRRSGAQGQAATYIKTHNTPYRGTVENPPESYTIYSTEYITNPSTGSAWIWDEIDDLKAGTWNYCSNVDDGRESRSTQVWVEVHYSTSVWVEVDSISGNTSELIYMWYNGCTGGSSSNGDNTFEFFDDFSDGTTNKWTVVDGTWSATNYYLEKTNTVAEWTRENIRADHTLPSTFAVHSKIRQSSSVTRGISNVVFKAENNNLNSNDQYWTRLDFRNNPGAYGLRLFKDVGGSESEIGTYAFLPNQDQWYKTETRYDGSNIIGYLDGNKNGQHQLIQQ